MPRRRGYFITSTDNLKGFTEGITSAFTQSVTQICVVHHIRNALHYVVWKDKKEFVADLKTIYGAVNKSVAIQALDELDKKMDKKYPHAISSWRVNWDNLTHFFDYPIEIRTLIHTTNIIENLNGKIRKYTNNKLSFLEITKKWTMPVRNCPLIVITHFIR